MKRLCLNTAMGLLMALAVLTLCPALVMACHDNDFEDTGLIPLKGINVQAVAGYEDNRRHHRQRAVGARGRYQRLPGGGASIVAYNVNSGHRIGPRNGAALIKEYHWSSPHTPIDRSSQSTLNVAAVQPWQAVPTELEMTGANVDSPRAERAVQAKLIDSFAPSAPSLPFGWSEVSGSGIIRAPQRSQ